MKDAMSSHNLKGLSIIADFYILCGILMFVSSFFLVFLSTLFAVIPLGAGIILIAIGHYLDDLHRFSWWAVVLSNFVALAITSYSVVFLHTSMYDITFIINLVVSSLCLGYLMKRDVRNLFFEGTASL